jgi:hypothetical protein
MAMGDIKYNFSVFTEYYSTVYKDETAEQNFDCGVTYLVRKNIRVDCAAGRIISDGSSNWLIKFGVAFRLPY